MAPVPLVDLALKRVALVEQRLVSRRQRADQRAEALPERLCLTLVPGTASAVIKSYRGLATRSPPASTYSMLELSSVMRCRSNGGGVRRPVSRVDCIRLLVWD